MSVLELIVWHILVEEAKSPKGMFKSYTRRLFQMSALYQEALGVYWRCPMLI